MFVRITTLGTTLLLTAVTAAPAASQARGTVEFGGYASSTSFDSGLNMNNAFGGGGRVGIFLLPRLSVEFDGIGSTATRTLGLRDVNVGMVHARVTAVPLKMGRASLLVGAGVNDFDTNFHLSYGVHGLVGAKLGLSDAVSLRVDAIQDLMSMGGGANRSFQAGLSVYRHPGTTIRTVTRDVPGPATAQRPDSVSAAETARLRAVEAEHRAMLAAGAHAGTHAATMAEVVHFAHDASELDGAAVAILNRKVTVLQANPMMRMRITGHASEPGTDLYNTALGLRRAEAVRAHLASRGVTVTRIEVASAGRQEPVASGSGAATEAANRRAEFRILN